MGRTYNTTFAVNAPDANLILPTGDLMPHARAMVGIRTLATVERPAHSPILPFMRLSYHSYRAVSRGIFRLLCF